jgi:hypothetical protein
MVWVRSVRHDDRVQPNPYQPQYPHQQPVPYPVVVSPRPTSGKATAALIMGIVSVLGGACLVIPPFVAVGLGHLARRETRTGQRGGNGMAVAGLIMGYLGVVAWLLFGLQLMIGLIAGAGQR